MILKSMVKRCLIRLFGVVVVMILLLPAGVRYASAAADDTTRVSIASDGTQGNNDSGTNGLSISPDGRYVVFRSSASTLVSGDTNGYIDVFVHDRQTHITTRVSVASDGTQGNNYSESPSISADGRYVAFGSRARNLVNGDTNESEDIFVHDRQTGATTRVSVSSAGEEVNDDSLFPSISADGRFVVFQSRATNLVSRDTNGAGDIFVHDCQTGTTSLASLSSSGIQGNNYSYYPSITADGRYIAFESYASNLVSGDTNGYLDVFVHDQQTGTTTRVSVASDGTQGNNPSGGFIQSISSDGRYIAFNSSAYNLVSGDTNGYSDIFVHDRQTSTTTRVSVASDGSQGNNQPGSNPCITPDGRYVVFSSKANNLVENDTNRFEDIFVHDRQTGITIRVSSSNGVQANNASVSPSISSNSEFIAYASSASNLVSGDTNERWDVFVFYKGSTLFGHTIQDGTGKAISEVTISIGSEYTITTDGHGDYTITSLPPGTYLVTPEKAGYIFSPASRSVTVPPDGGSINFTATGIHTISGHIQDSSGNPIKGVTVSGGPGYFTATNASGDYTLTELPPGTYMVTPSKTGYSFSPNERMVTVPPDGASVDFIAAGIHSLSGHIQDGAGNVVSGVTVSAGSAYSSTTDASGNYTIGNLPPGTYMVTPSKSGYTFSPTSRSVSVPPDATGINFIGGPPPPTHISPANGGTISTWLPTYTWNDIPEATYFKLYLGKPDNSQIFAQWYTRAQANCDGSTCHVTPDAIIATSQNKWCVKSYNASGGAWSSWWNFYSPANPAAVTSLDSPSESETVSTWTPTFTWHDDSNVTHFKLWIGKPDGRTTFAQWYTRAQANCDGTHCSVAPDGIINPGQNRWYVKSYNPNGGAWSSAGTFKHDNILLSPADGSTVSDSWKPTYSWVDIPNVSGFYLWVGLPDGTRKFYKYYSRADATCDGSICSVMPPDYSTTIGQNRWYIVVSTSGGNRYSDPATFTRP